MTKQEQAQIGVLQQDLTVVSTQISRLSDELREFKQTEQRARCKHNWAFTTIEQYTHGSEVHFVMRRCLKCGLTQRDLFGSPWQSLSRLKKFRKRQEWKFDHKE